MDLVPNLDQNWDRLLDVLQGFTTIAVALLVAWLAVRKETNLQKSQRHFQFRDERANLYAEFIKRMNFTFARYWDCLGSDEDPLDPDKKTAERAALELDTQSQTITILAPQFVSHACANMNGHLQRMTTGLMFGQLVEPADEEYEKLIAAENQKYFQEATKNLGG